MRLGRGRPRASARRELRNAVRRHCALFSFHRKLQGLLGVAGVLAGALGSWRRSVIAALQLSAAHARSAGHTRPIVLQLGRQANRTTAVQRQARRRAPPPPAERAHMVTWQQGVDLAVVLGCTAAFVAYHYWCVQQRAPIAASTCCNAARACAPTQVLCAARQVGLVRGAHIRQPLPDLAQDAQLVV